MECFKKVIDLVGYSATKMQGVQLSENFNHVHLKVSKLLPIIEHLVDRALRCETP